MPNWYRVQKWGNTIDPVKVVRVGKKLLTTEGIDWRGNPVTSRTAISSEYCRHFPSWEEARQFLIQRVQDEMDHADQVLRDSVETLAELRQRKNPDA